MALKKEIGEYYERRASTYSDLDEPKTIVACVRRIGAEDHLRIIAPEKEQKILDIGCGNGRFLKAFLEHAEGVFGADISLHMLKEAQKTTKNIVRADSEHLPFKDNAFDIVHSAGLLGIYHSEKILEESERAAKKNGRILISFPALESVSGLFFRILSKFKYNPTLLDCWYRKEEIEKMFKAVEEKKKTKMVLKLHKLGWEMPFQRVYKNVESPFLVKIFIYLEKNLREAPFFTYFKARWFAESEKI